MEGAPKKAGVKCDAANGAKVDRYGEKRVRFMKDALNGIKTMASQVSDVGKSLVSMSRIQDKRSSVVFPRGANGVCVVNDRTGRRIPLVQEGEEPFMEVVSSHMLMNRRILPGRVFEMGRLVCWPCMHRL